MYAPLLPQTTPRRSHPMSDNAKWQLGIPPGVGNPYNHKLYEKGDVPPKRIR